MNKERMVVVGKFKSGVREHEYMIPLEALELGWRAYDALLCEEFTPDSAIKVRAYRAEWGF